MRAVLIPLIALWQLAPVGDGPKPSATPVAWELEFEFRDPQRIEVQLPGAAAPEVYWYVIYTVANTSGRAQQFFPTFQIVTDDLRVLDTDIGIAPLVFEAVKERHKLIYKYLVPPTGAIGTLRAGRDYARESVAIWRQVDLTQNNFSLYVAGLSGETRLVQNPTYDPQAPEKTTVTDAGRPPREVASNPRYFTLRKTLRVDYTVPGSPGARLSAAPLRTALNWIMR